MSKNKLLWVAIISLMLVTVGCRQDMHDQPRYEIYDQSDFFPDGRASRDFPQGTVPRGFLREDKAFYTGMKANADPNAQVQTTTDAAGNTRVASFPNHIERNPMPVTKELLDRGEDRYKIYCMVCHGPHGNGDGMIVRRGYPQPPSYNDDRLRGAPDGYFFDVITNGQGRMNSYAAQVPVTDRWAIVAYIRALQTSQNPHQTAAGGQTNTNTATPAPASSPNAANQGGAR